MTFFLKKNNNLFKLKDNTVYRGTYKLSFNALAKEGF